MRKTIGAAPIPIEAGLASLHVRHQALLRQLQHLGLVLRGTITPRPTRCTNPGCRCNAEPQQLHGPNYIWTRKVAGKTVTASLPAAHIELCQEWTHNMRELDRIVSELQAIGLEAAALVRGRPTH